MSLFASAPDILAGRLTAAAHERVKRDLAIAQQEVTTGEKADRVSALGGDTAQLMSLDRHIREIEERAPQLALAMGRAGITQTALARVQADAARIGAGQLDNASNIGATVRAARAAEAGAALQEVIFTLNTAPGGRALFAGAAVDSPAVSSADTLLNEVRAIFATSISLSETPQQALARIDDYFDPASAAPTTIVGAVIYPDVVAGVAPGVSLDDGERLDYAVRADDPALLDLMKGYALAALAEESGYAGVDAEVIRAAAGQALSTGDVGVSLLRGDLGAAEARIEETAVAQQSERTTLTLARNGMIGVDDFEAATRLRRIETQLEALYAITARAANLSFVNYLR
ncbi:flagellin [Rubrimonas cliftonensis]|uniref:Flagellar hook-associated protein 3 FlgL n=1 Tax=Rubrimonas cliftonensis TaxID=89524 RepID=A0A1H3VWW4_9RHOB|nr:flagellin [Rubrimonas cliftonensis]SDZ78704.1 flagellar hook-associated protein 3 FlgL [Rubrimonas cliftonensis]